MLRKIILISAVVALVMTTGNARGGNGNQEDSDITNHGGKSHSMHQGGKNRGGQSHIGMSPETTNLIADIPLSELTDTQKENLTFMIEEEKVARDVYKYLYETHGTRIFGNIARAEQKHMDALEVLLDRYELEAPLTLGEVGVFENDELQELYDTLIAKGQTSVLDALRVGVAIEEVDIADLEDILNDGVPEDFTLIYENLVKGSYNHLNAFNRQIDIGINTQRIVYEKTYTLVWKSDIWFIPII